MPEHDCLPADLTATDFVTHMGRMSGLPARRGARAHGRRPPPRRPLRGALPADRDVLDRHEAAGEARAGARPRPADPLPRRADERPRPGRPRGDARPDPADRDRVRHHRHRQLAPARRDRARLRATSSRSTPGRLLRAAPLDVVHASSPTRSRSTWRTARGARRARSPPAGSCARGRAAVARLRLRPRPDAAARRPYDVVRDTIVDLGLPLVRHGAAPSQPRGHLPRRRRVRRDPVEARRRRAPQTGPAYRAAPPPGARPPPTRSSPRPGPAARSTTSGTAGTPGPRLGRPFAVRSALRPHDARGVRDRARRPRRRSSRSASSSSS